MTTTPIYDALARETRRHLALVPIPTCRPTETRLAILNDGTRRDGGDPVVGLSDDTNPAQPDHWWAEVDKAPRCTDCGCRLDKPERACPMGPHGVAT